ncbi:MAG TPA: TIGR02328 family protein [Bacillales bacterium]|nr:TIGR02328 family protein [Bacillales bacterium]
MRLWHESLIPQLPRQQLLGQHRECCALRGRGWGKPHATVNYVFEYAPERLFRYHLKVIQEMKNRGYHVDPLWEEPFYRGKQCPPYRKQNFYDNEALGGGRIYPEHNEEYLKECLENLHEKGIELSLEGDMNNE